MITPEAYDLITKLLEHDPMKRFGACGAEEIKQHPFFRGIDWENIRHMKPPLQTRNKTCSNL